MSKNVSPLATFQSLGTRERFLFTDTAKGNTFESALESVDKLLNTSDPDKAPSIQHLVKTIFDRDASSIDLECIREVIRPNHQLGRHHISSSGTKLLAYLAIQQNQQCFKADGSLDVNAVEKNIRDWFVNCSDVSFDRRALSNIRAVSTASQQGPQRIDMGMKRVADVKLHAVSAAKDLETSDRPAASGMKEIEVNLSAVPRRQITGIYSEAAIGDVKADSQVFLHQLIGLGMATVRPGKEDTWSQLAEKIKTNDITGFREQLSEAVEFKKTGKNLVIVGDLLSGPAHNSWFTLEIVNAMHEQGQIFSVTLSHHDAKFIEYHLANQERKPNENFVTSGDSWIFREEAQTSLNMLNTSLNDNPARREEFQALAKNFLSHVALVNCSHDKQTLYSSGVINDKMLSDMLTESGVRSDVQKNMGIQQKVIVINNHFEEKALASLNEFRSFIAPHPVKQLGNVRLSGKLNPFFFATYNRGPFEGLNFRVGQDNTAYANTNLPEGVLRAVYGGTENMSTRLERLENVQGACKNYLDAILSRETRSDVANIEAALRLIARLSDDPEFREELPPMLSTVLVAAKRMALHRDELASKLSATLLTQLGQEATNPEALEHLLTELWSLVKIDPGMHELATLKTFLPEVTEQVKLIEKSIEREMPVSNEPLASAQLLMNVITEFATAKSQAFNNVLWEVTLLAKPGMENYQSLYSSSYDSATAMEGKKSTFLC